MFFYACPSHTRRSGHDRWPGCAALRPWAGSRTGRRSPLAPPATARADQRTAHFAVKELCVAVGHDTTETQAAMRQHLPSLAAYTATDN